MREIQLCPNCQAESPMAAAFCATCGHQFAQGEEGDPRQHEQVEAPRLGKQLAPLAIIGLVLVLFCGGIYWFMPGVLVGGGAAAPGGRYTIYVEGTGNMAFQGTYMAVYGDGKTSSRTVDGYAPASYSPDGTPAIVSCSFQKQGTSGTLTVRIERSGVTVAEESTSAAYGVVTLGTR